MKIRLVRSLCLCLLVLALALPAATKPGEKVNLGGFKEFVARELKAWKVPGLAIAIVKDGQVVLAEGFGLRNVKQNLPVTARTLFAIGSCSKAFTAADVGILVDEGKLDWDTPVRTYLPAFKLHDPVASEQMTPRDLLCHRSGLPRHDMLWYGSAFSRQELFNRLQYIEPNKPFRAAWQYQNLMFLTAGYLVEKVSGRSWEAFTRERILSPLGMGDSNFSVLDSQKTADYSLPYSDREGKVEEIPFRNIDAIGPAGSINSNVVDMAKWLLLNLNKGKAGDKQVVSESSLGQIHSPQMAMPSPIQFDEVLHQDYGMGWMIGAYRGRLLLQHGGGIDGFISLVCFLPREKIGIVVLTNSDSSPLTQVAAYNAIDRLLKLSETPWSKRLKSQLDQAKAAAEKAKAEKDKDKDKVANTTPSHPLTDYCGEYGHPGYGVVTVSKEGDGLAAAYNSFKFKVSHYHYDVFTLTGEGIRDFKIIFAGDKKGRIQSLAVQLEPAVDDIVFTRLPEKKMQSREFLQKLCGEYELAGMIAKVALKGEKTLILTVPGQPEYELVPGRGSDFTIKGLSGFSVEFKLDASGSANEAVFNQPNGVFTAKRRK